MNILAIISVLVTTAALFGWLSSRALRIPLTIGTMLLTVLTTMSVATLGHFVPSVQTWTSRLANSIDFQNLIMHGMLPLLLFAGAFLLDLDHLHREKLPVAVLSVLGTVLSFLAIAALMFVAAGTGASWIECLIFGALISPTDPIAVLELLRRIGIPKSIEAKLAGESLFNDGIAAVLFLTMIEIAQGHAPTPWHVAGILVLRAGEAVALGIAGARIVSRLMCTVNAYQIDILLTLTLALGGYALADSWNLSAPLEAVVAGIALRHFNRKQPEGPHRRRTSGPVLDHARRGAEPSAFCAARPGSDGRHSQRDHGSRRPDGDPGGKPGALRSRGAVPGDRAPMEEGGPSFHHHAHLGRSSGRALHRSRALGPGHTRRSPYRRVDLWRHLHDRGVFHPHPGRLAAVGAHARKRQAATNSITTTAQQ